jgi:hypothetical protein
MPNAVKYSTTQPTGGILKSNVALGLTGNLGPTGTTGWYNGITPASGKYVIYETSLEATPHIYTPQNDTELIRFANSKGAGGVSTVTGALQWFAGQSGYFATNIDYPGIVTDSLSLNLNPSCAASYPLGGTVWYDLVNGLQFNTYGSQTSFSTSGGASSFVFNGSGYWACTNNFSLVDLAGDCTLIMWIYDTNGSHSDRKTIFQKNGTIYASYEQEIAVTWETNVAMSWYSRYADYDYASTPAVDNGWTMMGIKMSTGKGTPCRTGFYSKNGGSWTNNYFCRSNNPIVPADAIIIGNGYAGTVSQGEIGMVLCYNKMLSDSEILQNFNATKATYGL